MMNAPIPQQQSVYQAEPALVQSVKSARDRIHEVARHCIHRPVQVQTMDGHVHVGVVVHVDDNHLYLRVSVRDDQTRGFFNPLYQASVYNDVILPLVLYNLLVITLLYT
ncbi:acetyl-CoA acetyltransferase [Paenibacillus mesophilus]|uniref:acetyl-CoA acetyltransferase n=1 Tax=Paenibacillus mesophilus TaxID=2582849 RepID=UPI00110ECEB0|nr:acetyl-CoA acetyltransferase [Paenibacillus mesophilus]TMV46452.1 acetyl-CoA acetyltransferase [Paenibacillus mesophilus]